MENTKSSKPLSSLILEINSSFSRCIEDTLVREVELSDAYTFINDIEVWIHCLSDKKEVKLLNIISQEYIFSLMCLCQGQYRNSFKSLRLILEVSLQMILLSINKISLEEWLKGERDTIWAEVVDEDNGPLSIRACRALFPEISTHVAYFRNMARSLYRELSECIHGNIPKEIPLPSEIKYSSETFDFWIKKLKTLRHIIIFSFSMRYLKEIDLIKKRDLENIVIDQLGYIEEVRSLFEDC